MGLDMSFGTITDRSAYICLLVMIALLSGCTSSGRGASDGWIGNNSNADFLVQLCEGRGGDRYELFRYSTGVICESIIDGITAGFAALGRNNPESKFCVDREFQTEAYKTKFLRAMEGHELGDEERRSLVLSDLQTDEPDKKNCDWVEQATLGSLGQSCRWLELYTAADPKRRAVGMIHEAGLYTAREVRETVGNAVAHCGGYIIGFLLSNVFAEKLASESGFCDFGDFGKGLMRSNTEIDISKVSQIATELSDRVEMQPEIRDQPAGQYFYDVLTNVPDCKSDTFSTIRWASWEKKRTLSDLAAAACGNDPNFEGSYQFYVGEAYCDLFLAGLLDATMSIKGARDRTVACLPGSIEPSALKRGLKKKIGLADYRGRLERLVLRELGQLKSPGSASECRWQGEEAARLALESCRRVLAEEHIDQSLALEAGRSFYQHLYILGERTLDESARRDLSACMGYVQAFVYVTSYLPAKRSGSSVCMPESGEWEGVALLISLDVRRAIADNGLGPEAPVAGLVYDSTLKRAACEAIAAR